MNLPFENRDNSTGNYLDCHRLTTKRPYYCSLS